MQIVIDIPSEMYNEIKSGKDGYSNYIHTAVRNGTPLPKGHGRLIEAEPLYDQFDNYDFVEALDFAPTIITADEKGR